MKGLLAIFGCEDISAEQLKCILTSVAHRGVEDHMAFFDGRPWFSGKYEIKAVEPFRSYAFPHLLLWFDGIIYNSALLQKNYLFNFETCSNEEVILHLFNYGGIEFAVKNLDGIFGFTLMDMREMKLYNARDTYGVRPLFRLHTPDGMLGLCSEAKGLVDLATGSDALIQGVSPGHYEVYSLSQMGKVSLHKVVCFDKVGQKPLHSTLNSGFGDMLENLRHTLSEAVRKRMIGDRRIGCMLSGGLDSSLIAALVARHADDMCMKYPIQTFCIGLRNTPDIIAARKVAKHIGSEHHEKIFTVQEGLNALRTAIYHLETYDVITVRGAVAMYLLCAMIASESNSQILLSGEAADDLTQGYVYFRSAPSPEHAHSDTLRLLRELNIYDNVRTDRIPAAFGLDLRIPYLDRDFVSYFLQLPAVDRQPEKNGIEKPLLRKAFDGTGLLPQEILWRPKRGFSEGLATREKPWLSHLQDYAEEQVTEDELKAAPHDFPYNTPTTKEGCLYRRIFEEFYPNHGHFTPQMWMPRWIKATDPSTGAI